MPAAAPVTKILLPSNRIRRTLVRCRHTGACPRPRGRARAVMVLAGSRGRLTWSSRRPPRSCCPISAPREELVLLARTLWREGYNDHLAGHITITRGRHTAVQPVAAHVGRARPEHIIRIDLKGEVARGRLAGASRHPAAPGPARPAPRRRCRHAQPPAVRDGVGRHAGDLRRSTTSVRPRRWWRARAGRRVRRRGRQLRRRLVTRSRPWVGADLALLAGHGVFVLGSTVRAVHQRAVALEQRCQRAWHIRAAGGRSRVAGAAVVARPRPQERRQRVHRLLGGHGPRRAAGRPGDSSTDRA